MQFLSRKCFRRFCSCISISQALVQRSLCAVNRNGSRNIHGTSVAKVGKGWQFFCPSVIFHRLLFRFINFQSCLLFKMYFVIFSGSEVTMPDIKIWEIWVTFQRYQEIISTNPLKGRASRKDAKLISAVNILMNVVCRFTSLSQVHAEIRWI